MDLPKQKLLLSYLLCDSELYTLCQPIIYSRQWDPTLRKTVDYVKAFYQVYSAVPSLEQVEIDTGVAITARELITPVERKYAADEVEAFCKRKEAEHAVVEGAKLVKQGKYEALVDLVREASQISLKRDMGIDLYRDAKATLEKIRTTDQPYSTTWDDLDELLDGGLIKGTTTLVSANSGGGKSVLMANLALAMSVRHNIDVLIISLELSQSLIWARLATMITGIPTKEWRNDPNAGVEEVFSELARDRTNRFTIKRMQTGTNANEMRAYLKQYHAMYGKYPDMLVVDYLDCMKPVRNVDLSNVSERDKAISDELYEVGVDCNMINISASQQNRGAITQTHLDQSVIAGGLSKINAVDVYLSIVLNDAMRAQGKIALTALKTRSSAGVGKSVTLDWNPSTLTITNEVSRKLAPAVDPVKRMVSKASAGAPKSLLDLMAD